MAYPVVERPKHFKTGIVGGAGYTGAELVRLLSIHPEVSLEFVTSEQYRGQNLADVHPHLSELTSLELIGAEQALEKDVDCVFLALPHGVSQKYAAAFLEKNIRVIDLSGDFRLRDGATYQKWYGREHGAAHLLDEAVYGLPELYRNAVRHARLVANPGCYPTASILALWPLIREELIETHSIIIDAKSGVTGAGATPRAHTHFPRVTGNFSAYGIATHRHTPEIEQALSQNDRQPVVQFTPHLLPVDRGILATIYATPKGSWHPELVNEVFARAYFNEQFVRVMKQPPEMKQVRGSNYCDLHARYDERTGRIIIVSVIDNLVKGAAGQAIQNMNILFRLKENCGLRQLPVYP